MRPLWTDEAFTWHDYREPLQFIIGARLNVHPPAYGVGMHFWIPVAGDTEFAMRFPAALLGALVVPLTWRVCRDFADRQTALFSAILIALSPLALTYAREARMYSIVMSLGMASLLVASRFERSPTRAGAVAFGAIALASAMTHYTAIAAWAVGFLRGLRWRGGDQPRVADNANALSSPHARDAMRDETRWWVATNLMVAALGVIWAATLLANRDAWSNLIWLPWAGPTTPLRAMLDWGSAFVGLPLGPNGPGVGPWATSTWVRLTLSGAFFAAVGAGSWLGARRSSWRGGAWSVVVLALGPPLAIAAIEPFRATWHIRFVLVSLPAAIVLASIGIGSLRRFGSALPRLVFAGAVIAALIGFREAQATHFDDWRAVARVLRAEAAVDDAILGGVGSLVEYYGRGIARIEQRPVTIGRSQDAALAELAGRVGPTSTVWLVPSQDGLMDPLDVVGTVLGRSAQARDDFDAGGTRMTRFRLRPGSNVGPGPALTPRVADFGGIVRLDAARVERSQSIDVSLAFTMVGSTRDDLKVFMHVLDQQGRTMAQKDVFLVDERRRTTSTVPFGQNIRLELSIDGETRLIGSARDIGIGVYREANGGERLPLTPPAAEHRLLLRIDGGP